jgi:hypothetical protein
MRCGCHVGNSGTWLRGTMGSWRGTRADVRAQGGGAISPVVASMAGMVTFFFFSMHLGDGLKLDGRGDFIRHFL